MKLYSYYCIEVNKETYVLCYQKVLKISFRLNLWGAGGKSAPKAGAGEIPNVHFTNKRGDVIPIGRCQNKGCTNVDVFSAGPKP